VPKEGTNMFHGTTIVSVRRDGRTAMAGDGQVTLGHTIMKHTARKVRVVAGGTVLAGFAGSTADAMTLLDRFEQKLEKHGANLTRALVELARDWRTDRVLRRLEALMAVADREHSFVVSGSGDVIEPDDGIVAIGSGGSVALAAARALMGHTSLSAAEIAREALLITAGIEIHTNDQITLEELGP
jgi:ATP-dependent HslUV protease subunit HslV